ncbi:MAG: PKD domain-containing protein [Saprospiraceae bacterium]|nr:PKD domain-containing protein [Saprospiraceae bacterium]
MFRFQLTICLFSLLLVSGPSTAQNVYLAYDAFDHPAGTPLHQSSGGSGWGGNWSVQNESTTGYVYTQPGLNYGALQTIGGSISGGDVYLTAGRNLDITDGGPFADYVTGGEGIGSVYGTTLWVSAMLQKNQDDRQHIYFDLHNSNIDWCNECSTDNRIGVGYFGSASEVGGEKRWSIRIQNQVFTSSKPVTISATAFLVVRLDFNSTGTTVSLYVNPTELGNDGPPASPDIVQNTDMLARIRAISLYPGDTEGSGYMDELRFASTYPVVAPDDNINIILPPIADFTLSPSNGTAPLTVQVDASASSDPNGSQLTYSWNWGDGSPSGSGMTASHSYEANITGILQITLSVTNSHNLTSSLSKEVTIFNQDGSFPCQTSITMLNEAGCNQSDGRIRINNGLATDWSITFRNSNGTGISPTNENEFHNLSTGVYNVTITGSNGCLDTYQLHMTTDSTTCSGWSPLQCKLEMGVNINGIADWNNENSFINLAKQVRSDIYTFHDGCNCWDSGVSGQLAMDTDGYPTSIPQSTTASPNTMIRYVLSSENANLRANHYYVFLYDGVADISPNGVNVIEQSPGRIYFQVPAQSGNIWLDVTYSQSGNYMRNFRLLRAEHEYVNLDENIFNPVFLSRLSPFTTIRFMDWGSINNSPQISWSDRAHITDRTYGTASGVPFEMMIALANKLNKDVWICIPHMADDDYITQMATLFKNNLNPELTIYLEYSNEVWNWIFGQAHYNNENRPPNLNYGRAYAEKAKRVFTIWHTVFSGQTERVKRVLGIQGGFNYINEQILSQLPADQWDLASPTYYFGLDHSSTGNPVLNAASTGEDVNLNARNAYFGVNGNPGFKDIIHQDYRNIKVFGKGIVSYEGGQHYTDFNVPPYINAMYAAQYLPSMYDLYNDVLEDIRNHGNRLAMAFTLSGVQESIYGSWGHLPDIYMQPPYADTAPKYQACLDNACLPFKPETDFPLAIAHLTHFNVRPHGYSDASITWRAETTTDINQYQLQRQSGDSDFLTIYQTTDNAPGQPFIHRYLDQGLDAGTYYYRLLTSDFHGNSKYSAIIPLTIGNPAIITITPNPGNGIFHLSNLPHFQKQSAIVTTLAGIRVRTYNRLPNRIDLTELPDGIYILSINGTNYKLIKNGQ